MSERIYALYERRVPAALRRLLRPWISSPQTLRWVGLYGAIGLIGVAIYLALVAVLARAGWPALAATVLSMIAGASVQFVLNRNVNFRAFDRAPVDQAGTFGVVFALSVILTLAVVAFGTHVWHLGTLAANALSVPLVVPIAYLANRHLTFGAGIRAGVAAAIRRARASGAPRR